LLRELEHPVVDGHRLRRVVAKDVRPREALERAAGVCDFRERFDML
ncbi:MAG: hypothetical protein HY678_06030, partial [Chloroflexi bacterium]|nr:hypothetical protein [Chloroflexota bacterium]